MHAGLCWIICSLTAAVSLDHTAHARLRNPSNADESAKFVDLISDMLEEAKRRQVEASSKISQDEEHSNAFKANLAQRKQALSKYTNQVVRLEQCLRFELGYRNATADNEIEQAKKAIDQKILLLKAREAIALAKEEAMETRERQLADRERAFDDQARELQTLRQGIAVEGEKFLSKSRELQQREKDVALREKQVSLTENREKQEQQVETSLLELIPTTSLGQLEPNSQKPANGLSERRPASDLEQKHDVQRAPESQRNRGRDPWIVERETCMEMSKLGCAKCIDRPTCGWCSAGGCMLHHVNTPSPSGGDGLTSGNCSTEHWLSAVSGHLRVLSFNLFASDRRNPQPRVDALAQLVQETRPDVLLLQETEHWLLELLRSSLQTGWLWTGYYHSDLGTHYPKAGLYIISRYPFKNVAYYEKAFTDDIIDPGLVLEGASNATPSTPSFTSPQEWPSGDSLMEIDKTEKSDRGKERWVSATPDVSLDRRARLLVAQIEVHMTVVLVATTCLDWRSTDNRARSLQFLMSSLRQHVRASSLTYSSPSWLEPDSLSSSTSHPSSSSGTPSASPLMPLRHPDDVHLVLAGDMNFEEMHGGGEVERAQLAADLVDVWPSVHPNHHKTPGFTWDPETNEYARVCEPKSIPSRLDRVYIRSSKWRPKSIELVGCANDVLCSQRGEDNEGKKGVFLSPHLGLLSEFSLFSQYCP